MPIRVRLVLALLPLLPACAAPSDVPEAEEALGTTTFALSPPLPGPFEVRATRVSVGLNFACALLADGGVACWGNNADGQVGIGTFGGAQPHARRVAGLLAPVHELEVGAYHACATVGPDRLVQCWGRNDDSEVAPSGPRYATPTTTPGIAGASVHLGDHHTCVLRPSSAGQAAHCWGAAAHNRLGNGFVGFETATPQQVEYLGAPILGFDDITAGRYTSCGRRTPENGGYVWCWGKGVTGNNYAMMDTWMQLGGVRLGGVSRGVAVGADHWCSAIVAEGDPVICWGKSDLGQAGNQTTELIAHDTFEPVPGVTGAMEVAAGDKFTCARLTGGGARCWGKDDVGQLGNGTTSAWLPPVTVSGLAAVTQIAARGANACAISAGRVLCWGSDTSGQLGDGSIGGFRATPAPVRWPPLILEPN